jgi:hypothetical protein
MGSFWPRDKFPVITDSNIMIAARFFFIMIGMIVLLAALFENKFPVPSAFTATTTYIEAVAEPISKLAFGVCWAVI